MTNSSSKPYEPIIGLEIHAQLKTRTKAFCSCLCSFGAKANTHVCPVCLGFPGVLPTLNRNAVAMAVRAAMALDCSIHKTSAFARKHYFYPDLPKGYQITQADQPLATQGCLRMFLGEGQDFSVQTVRIERVHLEEDAGKISHGETGIFVDLNRAGTPLIEIVTAPELRSGHEAAEVVRHVRGVLMAIGVCDGDMEKGNLRCDVNISVRRSGEGLGTRTEVKNVNSFRFIRRAVDFEVDRQVSVIEGGGVLEQETRGWDDVRGCTVLQRSKEGSPDYRTFPDPDLPPLVLDASWLESQRASLPELPIDKTLRFVRGLGVSPNAARVLTSHPVVASVFEAVVAGGSLPVDAAAFLLNEVLRDVVFDGLGCTMPVQAWQIIELLGLVRDGSISGKQAKVVYELLRGTERSAGDLVREREMHRIGDESEIRRVCEQVVLAHPSQVKVYRAGKEGLMGFFVGEVMRVTRGSADPRMTNEILRDLLAKE